MPSDFRLSADRGIAVKNGRYGAVDGKAFIRQHVALALLDVLYDQSYGRRTEELIADVKLALRRRLENHDKVETLVSITIDRDAPRRVLRGEIVTDAVSVPFEEPL